MPFAVKVASKALKNVPSVETPLKIHIRFTFRKMNEEYGKYSQEKSFEIHESSQRIH